MSGRCSRSVRCGLGVGGGLAGDSATHVASAADARVAMLLLIGRCAALLLALERTILELIGVDEVAQHERILVVKGGVAGQAAFLRRLVRVLLVEFGSLVDRLLQK